MPPPKILLLVKNTGNILQYLAAQAYSEIPLDKSALLAENFSMISGSSVFFQTQKQFWQIHQVSRNYSIFSLGHPSGMT